MVEGPAWRHYILTAMVENPVGAEIIKQILPVVEKILHTKNAQPIVVANRANNPSQVQSDINN